VVGPKEREGRLVVKVAALPRYLLVVSGDEPARLLTPFAPLLPAGKPLLGFGQSLLRPAVVPGIRDCRAVRRPQKHLQAHINARLTSGERERLGRWGHLRTRETGIPAVGFPAEGNRLGPAFQPTMQPKGDMANLGQAQHATIQHRTPAPYCGSVKLV